MTGTLTRQQSRDHPRLRGEYHYICQTRTKRWGSPPLARGIQLWRQPSNLESGITPACAGNTVITCDILVKHGDHPRLRGEYILLLLEVKENKGSPPLARGILRIVSSTTRISGITPACAGNTHHQKLPYQPVKDHPRLRGEYHYRKTIFILFMGSPPLARGIH